MGPGNRAIWQSLAMLARCISALKHLSAPHSGHVIRLFLPNASMFCKAGSESGGCYGQINGKILKSGFTLQWCWGLY